MCAISADDGAVEALLCLEDVSVDVALVVLDPPLPLYLLASCHPMTWRWWRGCHASPTIMRFHLTYR